MRPGDPRRDDVLDLLANYTPADSEQADLRDDFINFVTGTPDCLSRECQPMHLTASGIIVTADGSHVLLNFHKRGQFWVQFGGHIDPQDAGIVAAATREVFEESGLALDPLPGIVNLDRHELSAAFSCGTHWDVQFICVADAPNDQAQASDESDEIRWFAVNDLPVVDKSVQRLIDAAVSRVRGQSA